MVAIPSRPNPEERRVYTGPTIELEGKGRRRYALDFSAGRGSSDGGGVLIGLADDRLGLTRRLAACFTDHRKPESIDHTVAELLAQRIHGLALGYEDLNDHEERSKDPLLAAQVGKADPTGQSRLQSRGQPLASPSTLGRLERTKADATAASRYETALRAHRHQAARHLAQHAHHPARR